MSMEARNIPMTVRTGETTAAITPDQMALRKINDTMVVGVSRPKCIAAISGNAPKRMANIPIHAPRMAVG